MHKLNQMLEKERDMYLYNIEMILGHIRLGTISKIQGFKAIRKLSEKMENLEQAQKEFLEMIGGMFSAENCEDTKNTQVENEARGF